MFFSLDTLDPFKFELITRRRGHEAVLKALDVALRSGLSSVKLNVVVVKGLNESEVLDFVNLTKDQDLSVRFIEFMPFTGMSIGPLDMILLLETNRCNQETNGMRQKWSLPQN